MLRNPNKRMFQKKECFGEITPNTRQISRPFLEVIARSRFANSPINKDNKLLTNLLDKFKDYEFSETLTSNLSNTTLVEAYIIEQMLLSMISMCKSIRAQIEESNKYPLSEGIKLYFDTIKPERFRINNCSNVSILE